jgi:hypothetical protein
MLEESWPANSFADIGDQHKTSLQQNSSNAYLAALNVFL